MSWLGIATNQVYLLLKTKLQRTGNRRGCSAATKTQPATD